MADKVEQLIGILRKLDKPLYHFTDERNLPSIRCGGIVCTSWLREQDLESVTGGNEWSLDADRRCGMDQYVHLTFLKNHPMEWLAKRDGRIENVRYIRVAPEVLRLEGVLMTNDVANKAGICPLPAEEMIGQLDWEVMYTRMDWKIPEISARRKAAQKYEILIPEQIPVQYLSGI